MEQAIRDELARLRRDRNISLNQQARDLRVPVPSLHDFISGRRPFIGERLRAALARTYPGEMIPLLVQWAMVASKGEEVGAQEVAG